MSAALTTVQDAIEDDERLAAIARYDILDTPPEPAFDRIASLIRMVFGVETSLVSLMDAHRQWYKAAQNIGMAEVPMQDAFCRHAISGTEPLIVPDASKDSRFADSPFVLTEQGIRFYASMPLTTPDGHNIGTICAIDSRPREFSENDIKIFREFAKIAINELELRRLATTDGLTGINTRRAFKEDSQIFVAFARRHRSQLSAITFDIDKFKTINDTYGHAAGDSVLKSVTLAVSDLLRQSDVIGRLGGEEFAIILPDTDSDSAMTVAEKLRRAISELRFAGSKPPISVTASFGVATLDPGQDDLDSLLVKADEALYEAKRSGRNISIPWRGTTVATTKQIERRRVLKAGRLIFNEQQSVIDCTVRALWDDGAEVIVSDSAHLPEDLTLEIRSSGFKWDGHITKRRPTSIELAFEAPKPA